MFIRLKFPSVDGDNYLVLYEYQFTATNTYDVLELSKIFAQSPLLMMILGSQKTFTLSGSLFIKTQGNNYVVDGLYDAYLNLIQFYSPKYIINRFNQIAKVWNNGVNNTETDKFTIQYVDTINDSNPISENFLPESFSFSINSRDAMIINVSISGKIGEVIKKSS
jgi:hypothetical protein